MNIPVINKLKYIDFEDRKTVGGTVLFVTCEDLGSSGKGAIPKNYKYYWGVYESDLEQSIINIIHGGEKWSRNDDGEISL